MTPTHTAALNVALDSFAMLRASMDGLPDEALDWSPAPGVMNPLSVLIVHSLTASRFLIGLGCGRAASLSEYRAGERAASFATKSATVPSLRAQIDAMQAEIVSLLESGTQTHLEAWIDFPEDASFAKSGVQCLVHGVAHLREHVGHAQALHDLWVAGVARQ